MSESESPPQENPQESPESGDAAPPEEVTEFQQAIDPQVGESPTTDIEKLRPLCTQAEQNYSQVLDLIKEMKAAENVLHRFHGREEGVTHDDVEVAKERFNQAKQSYLQLGSQINEGIKQVHHLAKTYPEDYLVQNLYKIYLAKLLASLETRNPTQPFVALIATGGFDFQREDIMLTDGELQRDKTQESMEQERLADINKEVVMLEVRFQKRQLANSLRQGAPPQKVIERLQEFLTLDPIDINTDIWLASMMSSQVKKERDQNKRLSMRDDILEHCKKALVKIDDYLNMQKIESLNERDRMRAEYVKTITAIRKPLLEK